MQGVGPITSRGPAAEDRSAAGLCPESGGLIRWFVLQTKPRQEKALASDLMAMSIDHYLPLQDQVRYYGNRKRERELPLFPGYVFLKGTLEDAYGADRTKRVARLIDVSDQVQITWELAQIRRAIESGASLAPVHHLGRGHLVEVSGGPFRGLQGIIEGYARCDRLILGINLLGQAVSLEVDVSLLVPLLEPSLPKDRRLGDCGG
jgi:transcription antitermination factor NusG